MESSSSRSQAGSSSSASGAGSGGGGRKRKSTATDHVDVEVRVPVPGGNEDPELRQEDEAEPGPAVHVDLGLSLGPRRIGPQEQAQNPPEPRVCLECGATETSLWRRGPRGLRTLCNACGLRYWKEEKVVCTKLTIRRPGT